MKCYILLFRGLDTEKGIQLGYAYTDRVPETAIGSDNHHNGSYAKHLSASMWVSNDITLPQLGRHVHSGHGAEKASATSLMFLA